MTVRRQLAVAVLTASSSPRQFRRARQLSGRTIRQVCGAIGISFPMVANFELGKLPLAEHRRVKFAQVVNAALADLVRELRNIGALTESQQAVDQISP